LPPSTQGIWLIWMGRDRIGSEDVATVETPLTWPLKGSGLVMDNACTRTTGTGRKLSQGRPLTRCPSTGSQSSGRSFRPVSVSPRHCVSVSSYSTGNGWWIRSRVQNLVSSSGEFHSTGKSAGSDIGWGSELAINFFQSSLDPNWRSKLANRQPATAMDSSFDPRGAHDSTRLVSAPSGVGMVYAVGWGGILAVRRPGFITGSKNVR
jgi:hypothetical protein